MKCGVCKNLKISEMRICSDIIVKILFSMNLAKGYASDMDDVFFCRLSNFLYRKNIKRDEEVSMNSSLCRTLSWTGVCFSAFMLMTGSAFAVHDLGIFELDGNAIQNAATTPPDDWQTLYNNGQNNGGHATVFTGIKQDPAPNSIFNGGLKDIQDISGWSWKDGSVPDKSDITNAYAAAYNNNGELIIYFGADRVSNVGDTYLGFWFFKNAVSANPNGTFSGSHANGDVLVLVNFPQGSNAQPLVQVVAWDTTCKKADSSTPQTGQCAAQNLRLKAGVSGAGAICGSSSNDLVCAITNSQGGPNDPTPAPWPYVPKSGASGSFPYETFFEGGINISQLVGGDGCFTSFMTESRASSSFTAQLKDFVTGSFPVCAIGVTKLCSNPTFDNANNLIIYDLSGRVTNKGFGTVYNVTIADQPPADSLSFVDCDTGLPQDPSSLAGGASICYKGKTTVPPSQNGTADQITATAYTGSNNTGTLLQATADATCPILQISPALSVSKTCSASVILSSGMVVASVDSAGQVCNVGDTKITNISVVDDQSGTLLSGLTLLPGACKAYTGQYKPSLANDISGIPTTDPSKVIFKDIVTVSGTDIFGRPVQQQSAVATCPLCPDNHL